MTEPVPISPAPDRTAPGTAEPLLRVDGLTLRIRREDRTRCELLSAVSFQVRRQEIFALVGESGCGKSICCLALARLHPEPPFEVAAGRILVAGQDVLTLAPRALRTLRGGTIAYIFQDPGVCLNPVQRIGTQIAEAIRLHDRQTPDVRGRVVELLRQVGIADPELRARAYPHELSGGMQQRVMIAMALSCRPAILVADEPTTALDVTIQAQILDLLRRLRDETGTAIILITHNLGVVAGLADTVAVMYAGEIVETAPTARLLRSPQHPYTQALLAAVPRLGDQREELATIAGRVPAAGEFPPGCRFAPRCACRQPACTGTPAWTEFEPGHWVRCDAAGSI